MKSVDSSDQSLDDAVVKEAKKIIYNHVNEYYHQKVGQKFDADECIKFLIQKVGYKYGIDRSDSEFKARSLIDGDEGLKIIQEFGKQCFDVTRLYDSYLVDNSLEDELHEQNQAKYMKFEQKVESTGASKDVAQIIVASNLSTTVPMEKEKKLVEALEKYAIQDLKNNTNKGLDKFFDELGKKGLSLEPEERDLFSKALDGNYQQLKQALSQEKGYGQGFEARAKGTHKAVSNFFKSAAGVCAVVVGGSIMAIGKFFSNSADKLSPQQQGSQKKETNPLKNAGNSLMKAGYELMASKYDPEITRSKYGLLTNIHDIGVAGERAVESDRDAQTKLIASKEVKALRSKFHDFINNDDKNKHEGKAAKSNKPDKGKSETTR